MRWKSRSLLLAVVALAYVLIGALRASGGGGFALLTVVGLPVALALLWRSSAPPSRGEDWVLASTRSATRLSGFAGALLIAAHQAPAGVALFEAAAVLAVTLASVACLWSLARVARSGGLVVVPRSATRLHDAAALGAVGAIAALWVARYGAAHADVTAIIGASFAAGALGVIAVTSWRVGRLRRVDLGPGERLRATLGISAVGLAVGVAGSGIGLASPPRVLASMACASAFACTLACIVRDASWVARAQRTFQVVAIFGAPAALFAGSVAARAPRDAPDIAFLALALGVAIGLAAGPLGRPLGPEQSRWSDGIRAATRASLAAEPTSALTNALTTLRVALGPSSAGPELWSLDPPTVFFVDRAGYGQRRHDPSLPPIALELCEHEPEQTLRTEVLATVEVRRPDIRPLLAWLRDRDALSLTLLRDEHNAIGALMLPTSGRTAPLTLEEVHELRGLADRLSCLEGARALIARSHAREMSARGLAERAEDRALHVEHRLSSMEGRHEVASRRFAGAANLAAYSPAARLALDELARLGRLDCPVTLFAPPGVDPVPFAAHLHEKRGRARRPFVVVDAAASDERDIDHWRDGLASPLCLAEGGSLLVLNIAALPSETQVFLAESLAARRAPGASTGPLDAALIASVSSGLEAAGGVQLDPALADRLGEHAVHLPALATRAEDLPPLFLDRLARIGLRLRGRPLGLEPKALARLVEHSWPGNELELDDVLTRAVAMASGDVLTVTHLDQVGFVCRPVATDGAAAALRRPSRLPHPGERSTTQVP